MISGVLQDKKSHLVIMFLDVVEPTLLCFTWLRHEDFYHPRQLIVDFLSDGRPSSRCTANVFRDHEVGLHVLKVTGFKVLDQRTLALHPF